MNLDIYTLENHFKTRKHPYFIRSSNSAIIEMDEFIDMMMEDISTISRADIDAVLRNFSEKLEKMLGYGAMVRTRFGIFHMSASGSLDREDDQFLPGSIDTNHSLNFKFIVNREMEARIVQNIQYSRSKKIGISAAAIKGVEIVGDNPEQAMPGDTIKLKGLHLKFDPKDEASGIFLEREKEIVRIHLYPEIQPSVIHAIIPRDIGPGEYLIKLVNRQDSKVEHPCYAEAILTIAGNQ